MSGWVCSPVCLILPFIIEISDVDKRVEAVKELINELPSQNKDLLVILIVHLRK